MLTAKQCILEAEAKKTAIGHFNISNTETFWGAVKAGQAMGVPIFIGVSEGERDFVGLQQIVAMVRSLREEFKYPVFLNADHTYSFEKVKEAIDAGFDSVIIDGAGLSFEENITLTKRVVDYARETNPAVLVEAEIGYIGKSSKMLDELPEGAAVTEESVTKPEEAREFVEKTGVDLLAPAVGTVHGMMRKGLNPALHIERIREIREAAGVPLVLHGGSGSNPADIKEAIKAGISMVHVSTEIRVAYKEALGKTLVDNPEDLAPYKYLQPTVEAVEKIVREKLELFQAN